MLCKLNFQYYKSFQDPQELELKPLTVLLGKNNSGKSALLKLLAMLSGGLNGSGASPIRLNNQGVTIARTASELAFNNGVGGIELSLHDQQGSQLHIVLVIDWDGVASIGSCKVNGQDIDVSTPFNGLLPDGYPALANLRLPFDYIGPYRKLPQDSYSSAENETQVGVDGAKAYDILIRSSIGQTSLLRQVSQWYEQHLEGWAIQVCKIASPSGSRYEIVLSNKKASNINIVNAGQGINQVLPLIVRSFMPSATPSYSLLEEPETHLHPAAHGALAERFAQSYLDDANRHYVIETHSQNFVLRLRRMVAEGKLQAGDLGMYYVDFDTETNKSQLKRITVKDDGGVDFWPEGVFQETTIEARAIYNAQQNSPY